MNNYRLFEVIQQLDDVPDLQYMEKKERKRAKWDGSFPAGQEQVCHPSVMEVLVRPVWGNHCNSSSTTSYSSGGGELSVQQLLVLNPKEFCIDKYTSSQKWHEGKTYKYLNTYKGSKPIATQGRSEYEESHCPIK